MGSGISELSAATLRELHSERNRPLVLANVWDAASARIVEDAGFPAIATSSAGVAYALGYADGQQVPPEEMYAAIYRIARTVRIPVTADIEAGYGDVAKTARALIDAGAVGMNLEDYENDGLVPLDEQLERIAAVKAMGLEAGVPIVINARTEIYLANIGDPDSRLERSLERLQAFARAGADCLFIPGIKDEPTIERFVQALDGPLNILAVAGSPSIARLRELGVARISVGSGPMRATMALTRRIAVEMRDHGTYDAITTDTIAYPDANALFLR